MGGFNITIQHWHGVAEWTWCEGDDDICGICRTAYDGCAPDIKYPGDDSPVVWGACGHAYHLQCIQKWLASSTEQRCPMCRRAWRYKRAGKAGSDDDDCDDEEDCDDGDGGNRSDDAAGAAAEDSAENLPDLEEPGVADGTADNSHGAHAASPELSMDDDDPEDVGLPPSTLFGQLSAGVPDEVLEHGFALRHVASPDDVDGSPGGWEPPARHATQDPTGARRCSGTGADQEQRAVHPWHLPRGDPGGVPAAAAANTRQRAHPGSGAAGSSGAGTGMPMRGVHAPLAGSSGGELGLRAIRRFDLGSEDGDDADDRSMESAGGSGSDGGERAHPRELTFDV